MTFLIQKLPQRQYVFLHFPQSSQILAMPWISLTPRFFSDKLDSAAILSRSVNSPRLKISWFKQRTKYCFREVSTLTQYLHTDDESDIFHGFLVNNIDVKAILHKIFQTFEKFPTNSYTHPWIVWCLHSKATKIPPAGFIFMLMYYVVSSSWNWLS